MQIERQDKADGVIQFRTHLADFGRDPKFLGGSETVSTVNDLSASLQNRFMLTVDPNVLREVCKGQLIHDREDFNGWVQRIRHYRSSEA